MPTLISKSRVEEFSRVDNLDVFVDDVIGNKVYVKITKPGFQVILIMHYRYFEKMFEQYKQLKQEKKENGKLKA